MLSIPLVGAPVRDTRLSSTVANILQFLQTDPRNYRNFGVYWWFIKALIREYHTTDDCYLLGNYVDTQVAAMLPPGTLEQTLGRALTEYEYNARFNMMCAQVTNEEGEEVTIFDEDAGL